MPENRQDIDDHADLVPHFATRAEIAELREKLMSLQMVVRAIAEKLGADGEKLEDWALLTAQFKSAPGRTLATAQEVAASISGTPSRPGSGRPVDAGPSAIK